MGSPSSKSLSQTPMDSPSTRVHMGLFVTFNCLFKLTSNLWSLTTDSKVFVTTPMLPTFHICPVTCRLLSSTETCFYMFHSVLKGYSIQYSLPTFIHLANFFYLSELHLCHTFSESLPNSLSVCTEWPSAVPLQFPKLPSVKALSQYHCHCLFSGPSTRCYVPSGERSCLGICSPWIAPNIW